MAPKAKLEATSPAGGTSNVPPSAGDAFIQRVSVLGTDEGAPLLRAGTVPMNLRDILKIRDTPIEQPGAAQLIASAYEVDSSDQQALTKFVESVVWLPPYRPAPFVGHMARPYAGDDLCINALGFRDRRQTYVNKPEGTVRIFMTGGSTAWGSGASSQEKTIPGVLEQLLNERLGPATGYRYEVINAAFPAWSTTQEKLLIQQRLVDMHPDVIIMFSGNNDVHWWLDGRDIRWFQSYSDTNYVRLLNEMYKSSGHPELATGTLYSSRRMDCKELARITARNVEDAALVAARGNARLIFALQPNIVSTAKQLTQREQWFRNSRDPAWQSGYQALRDELSRLGAPNYQLLDLSRSFGEMGQDRELFLDEYHFADAGQRVIAEALVDRIDWGAIAPGPAVRGPEAPLAIVEASPIAGAASTEWEGVRVSPSRLNKNLQIVFDDCVLPTVVANEALTALVPPSAIGIKGRGHNLYIVDAMTGETSPAVLLEVPSDRAAAEPRRPPERRPLRWIGEMSSHAWELIRLRVRGTRKRKDPPADPPNIYPLW